MTALAWDQVGERTYATGVDRGVLYLGDSAVVWNGLTSVEEIFDGSSTPYYLDGIKYLNRITPGDYSAKMKALTYPDEFEEFNGILTNGLGILVHDQGFKAFGLSYRTLIGDDVSATDRGYRIHVLYNLSAVPDSSVYSTLADLTKPIEFGWTLSGRPENIEGYRPTAHVSFSSVDMEPERLSALERLLYGDHDTDPRLPSLAELMNVITDGIVITDHGDGTWTASGPDIFFEMLDDTTFQIEGVDATYLDDDTYEISST